LLHGIAPFAGGSQRPVAPWFAYPKGTSKRFRCEFNRDSGWHVLRSAGFDSVRMVAIDEDWSALRFRRRELIKPARDNSSIAGRRRRAAHTHK